MIHIYTGNGKGKTTAAFGLAMRASGQGLKVITFQFFKPLKLVCGEELSARKLKNIKVVKCDESHPIFTRHKDTKTQGRKVKKVVESMMRKAEGAIFNKKYNMVILDEIINVVDQNFFDKAKFLKLLKRIPKERELILTGRGDISEIEDYADYVTIMIDKKHPFRDKVGARKGIEF